MTSNKVRIEFDKRLQLSGLSREKFVNTDEWAIRILAEYAEQKDNGKNKGPLKGWSFIY